MLPSVVRRGAGAEVPRGQPAGTTTGAPCPSGCCGREPPQVPSLMTGSAALAESVDADGCPKGGRRHRSGARTALRRADLTLVCRCHGIGEGFGPPAGPRRLADARPTAADARVVRYCCTSDHWRGNRRGRARAGGGAGGADAMRARRAGRRARQPRRRGGAAAPEPSGRPARPPRRIDPRFGPGLHSGRPRTSASGARGRARRSPVPGTVVSRTGGSLPRGARTQSSRRRHPASRELPRGPPRPLSGAARGRCRPAPRRRGHPVAGRIPPPRGGPCSS